MARKRYTMEQVIELLRDAKVRLGLATGVRRAEARPGQASEGHRA